MTQLPMIHINGTDGHVLAEEYGTAIEALDKAIGAMLSITVHGRDYYPIGNGATLDAIREHHARLEHLRVVAVELDLIYAHIFEQLSQREERSSHTGVTG